MTLVRASHIVKTFAGVPVLQGVSWQIEPGRKVGLVGANGSGKSTLLNLLSGAMSADRGTIESGPPDEHRVPHPRWTRAEKRRRVRS